jgi:hypothetical protein
VRARLETALLDDPDVLVLDQPTVGLDPVLRHSQVTVCYLRRDLWAAIANAVLGMAYAPLDRVTRGVYCGALIAYALAVLGVTVLALVLGGADAPASHALTRQPRSRSNSFRSVSNRTNRS